MCRRHLSQSHPPRQTVCDSRGIGRRVDYASRPASHGRGCIAARHPPEVAGPPAHDFMRRRHLSQSHPPRQTVCDSRGIGRRVDYASRPASRGRGCIAARRSGVFSWGLMDLFECRAPMDLLSATKSFGSKSTKPGRIQRRHSRHSAAILPVEARAHWYAHAHAPHHPRVSPGHRRAPPRAARRAHPCRVRLQKLAGAWAFCDG